MPAPEYSPFMATPRTPGLWESTARDTVLRSLQLAKQAQGDRYRSIQLDLHNFYDGLHASIMTRVFALTHPKTAAQWAVGEGAFYRYLNITEMVTKTLSVIFHRPPSLDLYRKGSRLQDDAPEVIRWKLDQEEMAMPGTLRTLDEWVTLFRTVLVEVAWLGDRIRWLPHPPYSTAVSQGERDPSSLEDLRAVHVAVAQATDTPRAQAPAAWMSWTRETDQDGREHYGCYHWTGHKGDGLLRNPIWEDNLNRYGMFPFALFREHEPAPGEFYLPPREPLYQAQTFVNALLTDERWGLHWHTHPVAVCNGLDVDEKTGVVVTPGAWLFGTPGPTTPNGIKLEFVCPETNLELAEKLLENYLRQLAVSMSLPPDVWSGDSATRNLAAMKMQAHYLMMSRQSKLDIYRAAIRRLWKAHKAVSNVARGRVVYGPDVELEVTFAEVPYPVDEISHANALEKLITMGLASPIEILMSEQGLTREQAERRYAENLRYARELGKVMAPKPATGPTPATPPDVRDVE